MQGLMLQNAKFTCRQLKQLIEEWSQNKTAQKLWGKFGFLMDWNPMHKHQLNSRFFHIFTYYCILIKFKWILSDFTDQEQLVTNVTLKHLYEDLFFEGFFRKEVNFDIFCLYAVNYVCLFLSQQCSELRINNTLQSQLLIILVHVLLGIAVGTKIYPTLANKYLQTKKKSSLSKRKFSEMFTKWKITLKSVKKLPLPSMKNFKSKQKVSLMKSASQEEKDPEEEFKQALLKKLHIKPLPKIVPRKKNIHYFDRTHELSTDDNPHYQSTLRQSLRNLDHLKLKQLSKALELQQLEQGNTQNNKNFYDRNITFKKQHESSHYCFAINGPHHRWSNEQMNVQVTTLKSDDRQTSVGSKKWIDIINQIKGNKKKSQKNEQVQKNKMIDQYFDLVQSVPQKQQEEEIPVEGMKAFKETNQQEECAFLEIRCPSEKNIPRKITQLKENRDNKDHVERKSEKLNSSPFAIKSRKREFINKCQTRFVRMGDSTFKLEPAVKLY